LNPKIGHYTVFNGISFEDDVTVGNK